MRTLAAAAVLMLLGITDSASAQPCGDVAWHPLRVFPHDPAQQYPQARAVEIASDPIVMKNAGNRLELFAIGPSGTLVHSHQGYQGQWLKVEYINPPEGITLTPPTGSDVNLAVAQGDPLEIFAIGANALWRITKDRYHNWGEWRQMQRFAQPFALRKIWAISNLDGRSELFGLNRVDNKLYHTWRRGGGWSGFHLFEDPPRPPLSDASYVFKLDILGRIVVATGQGRGVLIRRQEWPNSSWLSWEYWPYSEAVTPIGLASNGDGRLELILRRMSGSDFHHTWQARHDTWSGQFGRLGRPHQGWTTEAAGVGTGVDGCMMLVALTRDGDGRRFLATRQQKNRSANWRDWQFSGGVRWSFEPATRLVVARRDFLGYELFARTSNGKLVHTKQWSSIVGGS